MPKGIFVRTEEHKKNISLSLMGHNVSKETTRKIVKANTKHGETKRGNISIEYKTWSSIKNRCSNSNYPWYYNYGGRGIKVCKEWINDYQQFLDDMGRRPNGYSIERIDNNKGYSKENCKWIPRSCQNNNRRNSIIFNGEIATHASKRLGGSRYLVGHRVAHGWSLKNAFNTPMMKNQYG